MPKQTKTKGKKATKQAEVTTQVSVCYIAVGPEKGQTGLVVAMCPVGCSWSSIERGVTAANAQGDLWFAVVEVALERRYSVVDVAHMRLKYYPKSRTLRRAKTKWALPERKQLTLELPDKEVE